MHPTYRTVRGIITTIPEAAPVRVDHDIVLRGGDPSTYYLSSQCLPHNDSQYDAVLSMRREGKATIRVD